MKKTILALLAVAATTSVMAEAQPYATITSAKGLSTVSVGNKLVNATSGMKLAQGAQIMTTAKSAITVDFAGACTATIAAGQALNVNLADCKSLVASKMNMGSGAAAGGLVESGAATFGVSSATAAVVGGALAITAVAGVADATRTARYEVTRNADGTFTSRDRDTGLTAIILADGTIVPTNDSVITADVINNPAPTPATPRQPAAPPAVPSISPV